MSDVVIVDPGVSNIDSVARAVELCGRRPVIAEDAGPISYADHLILPGVGAFPDGMRGLHTRGLIEALSDRVLGHGVPFLGICLGMQLLATCGTEVEETPGLGWIDATVTRMVPTATDRRVPHVGWNEVRIARANELFGQIASGRDFYFVHSYRMVCRDFANVLATTPYCGGVVSAVQRANVFGVQFHLEKSQRAGLELLRNFLDL